MLHPLQAATHPEARGITYERFMLERVSKQAASFAGKLKRGEPVMIDGRNFTLEWERANQKLRETGGLSREQSPRERYGIMGT